MRELAERANAAEKQEALAPLSLQRRRDSANPNDPTFLQFKLNLSSELEEKI